MKRSRAHVEEHDNHIVSGSRLSNSSLSPMEQRHDDDLLHKNQTSSIQAAAVEAGQQEIDDHLSYFCKHLSANVRRTSPSFSRLSIAEYSELFLKNRHRRGTHFVIQQHDHPISGTHYDLRLQINEVSSVSWAIMYGLPGNANSQRLNRNATETRIHCLWVGLFYSAFLSLLLEKTQLKAQPISRIIWLRQLQ